MLSKWKEQINQKNLGRFSSLANVVLFLCMAGLLPSGAKQFTPLTILVYILLGLWAVSTLLYFVLKKRYVSLILFLLFFLFYAAYFTTPLWSNNPFQTTIPHLSWRDGGLSVSKKWPLATFSSFTRGCMHACGAHLSLDRCKKPRTGRSFLQIHRDRAKFFFPMQVFQQSGIFFILSVRPGAKRSWQRSWR